MNVGGLVSVLAMTLLMVLQPFLVICGMHMALLPIALNSLATTGVDPFISVCNMISNFSIWGAVLAATIRFKDPDDKGNAISGFVSGFLGGINESNLFGVCLVHRRLLVTLSIGSVVSGILAGILQVKFYVLGALSIMCIFNFISADNPMNVVHAIICGAAGFAVSFVLSLIFGLTKEEAAGKQA